MKVNVLVTIEELHEMVLEKFFKGMDLIVDKEFKNYISSIDFYFIDKKQAVSDLIKKDD